MVRKIEFYFDFPSPYAYLAHTQLPKIAADFGTTVVYHPFRILELMKLVGNRPTTLECKNKGKYASADLQRWVKKYNVDFSRNQHSKAFDFAELDRCAMAAIEEGRGEACVTAIFAAIWGKPVDLSQRHVLLDVLSRAGLEGQELLKRANTDEMTTKLEAGTAAAAERGVFGAPTVFVGDQMYFGNDRLDFVVDELRASI